MLACVEVAAVAPVGTYVYASAATAPEPASGCTQGVGQCSLVPERGSVQAPAVSGFRAPPAHWP